MMVPVRDPWSKNPRVFLNTLDSKSVSTRSTPRHPLSANHLSRPALEQRGPSHPPGCTRPFHRQCPAEARPVRALPHPVPRRRLHTRILRVARAQAPLPALPSRQGPLAPREQRVSGTPTEVPVSFNQAAIANYYRDYIVDGKIAFVRSHYGEERAMWVEKSERELERRYEGMVESQEKEGDPSA